MALYHTLEALAFALGGHRDIATFLEDAQINRVAQLHLLREFLELKALHLGRGSGLLVMPDGRSGGVLRATLAVTKLHGLVAVLFNGLHVGDHAGTGLQHGATQEVAIRIIEAGHSDLFSDQSAHRFVLFPGQTLISTSTPLGSSSFISASMVLLLEL